MNFVIALHDCKTADAQSGFVPFAKNDLMAIIEDNAKSDTLLVRTVLGSSGKVYRKDVKPYDINAADDEADDADVPPLESVAASSSAASATPPSALRRANSIYASPKPESSPSPGSVSAAPAAASTEVPAAASDASDVLIHENLINLVRLHTGLNFDTSRTAVEAVLYYLQHSIPESYGQLLAAVRRPSALPPVTRDRDRLTAAINGLLAARRDSQQRNWRTHDDAQAIADNLTDLTTTLRDADVVLCRSIIGEDDFEIVHCLLEYYLMETRVALKSMVLEALHVVVKISQPSHSIVLSSSLQKELARDLLSGVISDDKWQLSAINLCIAVFSTGEQCPVDVYEFWSTEFILHIVNLIENSASNGFTEEKTNALISMLLSFNLHFAVESPSLTSPHSINTVMKSFEQQSSAAFLGERLLYLFNRGIDPVPNLYGAFRQNSVYKFLKDLFSRASTASFLYSNDLRVFLDILIRQLENFEQSEESRFESLDLLYRVLFVTEYASYRYRQSDLKQCLSHLAKEDDNGDAAVAAFKMLAGKLRDVFCSD